MFNNTLEVGKPVYIDRDGSLFFGIVINLPTEDTAIVAINDPAHPKSDGKGYRNTEALRTEILIAEPWETPAETHARHKQFRQQKAEK